MVSTMLLQILFTLAVWFGGTSVALNSFSHQAPYFIDDKLEQSIVFKSMDSTESEFQFEMADLLGLTERPRRIKKPLSLRKAASKFLLELYNTLNEQEEPQLSAFHNRATRSTLITKQDRTKIARCNNIITFSSKARKARRFEQDEGMSITFNTNHVPQDLQLIRAELRVFQNSKLGRQFDCEKNITVSVFQRKVNRKLQKIELKLIGSFTTTTSHKGWHETNVTYIMSKWLLRGYTPGGHDLIITTSQTVTSNEVFPQEDITPADIGLINVSGTEEYQPFIIGYFNGPELLNKIQHMRFKREMGKRKIYSAASQIDVGFGGESLKLPKTCERMNFSIDFKDLQMQDWVIAPKKFEAYFCGGECNFPLGSKMNATNHAIVQTLMHLKQPNLPKPCCVPTILSSISILHYLNEDSVNLSKYPNSVAKSCGCH